MKVLQIIPCFVLGGAETMCENLLYSLTAQYVDTMVISLYDYRSPITERLEKSGIRIIYLNKKKGLDLSMIFKLRKIFKYEKPDVIHTHLYTSQYAVPAAIMTGIKGKVHTVHSAAYRECGRAFRKVSKFFYKHCNVVPVALSELIRDTIVDQYGLEKNEIPVIFNAIDLKRCIVKNNYNISSAFQIIHVGRFNEVKNHKMLIKVFAEFHKIHQNSELHLIGDGPLEGECKIYAEKLDVKKSIVFHGACSNVHQFLSEADVFVLPSHCEGVPLTIIEAMGTGLPILATAVGGIPDMIEHNESGLLVKVDENELLEAMLALYNDENLRERLGKNALKRSNDFSAEQMAKEYIRVYKKRNFKPTEVSCEEQNENF